jgi:hypothetical protein
MTDNIMISSTGTIHGRGSDIHKWVSGLTAEEREHCRSGGLVLIRDRNPHPATTEYKRVVYWQGKYSHRNYTEASANIARFEDN